MQRDIDFAIWCARKCLHLWNAPDVVKDWLKNPKPETAWSVAAAARASWSVDSVLAAEWEADAATASDEAVAAALAAARAANAAFAAAWAAADAAVAVADAAVAVADAVAYAAKALHTTVIELKLEYVKTWTDDELGEAEEDWIEVSTVELFAREPIGTV